MAKKPAPKARFTEVFSNEWGRDVAAARRAAEAAEAGREQLDVQSQALEFDRAGFDQRNTIIAQNNEIIGLLRYVAEQLHEESAPGSGGQSSN